MTSSRALGLAFGAMMFAACGGSAADRSPGVNRDGGNGAGGNTDASSTGASGTTGIINLGDVTLMNPGNECDGGVAGDGSATVPAVCGDGKINQTDEKCDDGNTESGDGCTANCRQIEANFACPTPGQNASLPSSVETRRSRRASRLATTAIPSTRMAATRAARSSQDGTAR